MNNLFKRRPMAETPTKKLVEKDAEEQREWLSDLVKLVVLIWSASLLTFSYVRLPNGERILDFDPTFIASVFSGSLAGFGIAASKNGGNLCGCSCAKNNTPRMIKKKIDQEPPIKSSINPKKKR